MEIINDSVILLVEDDPGDQKLMKYALKHQPLGSLLKIANNGEEALEYIQSGMDGEPGYPRPDLIFLDLNMPGMGGKEFLKRLKENPESCDIPVVIVSTSNADSDISDAYRLHAAGYVQKSPSPCELQNVVEKLTRYWLATCLTVVRKKQMVS